MSSYRQIQAGVAAILRTKWSMSHIFPMMVSICHLSHLCSDVVMISLWFDDILKEIDEKMIWFEIFSKFTAHPSVTSIIYNILSAGRVGCVWNFVGWLRISKAVSAHDFSFYWYLILGPICLFSLISNEGKDVKIRFLRSLIHRFLNLNSNDASLLRKSSSRDNGSQGW